jgi:outer membrane protein
MNKISIVLNVLLIAAVAYLYYLHYEYINEDAHKQAHANAAVLNSFKIAYFEMDSLQDNYEFYKQVRDELTKKDQANAEKLNKIKTEYYNKAKELQDQGSAGKLTAQQQSDYQQTLMSLQNTYTQTEQDLTNQMQAEMNEKLGVVKKKIEDYLKAYCAQKGLAYVFGASSNDNFLYYKDTIRNITPDLIKGLNDEYKKGKTK